MYDDFVINISVPFLDKMVARMPPVVSAATPYAAVYKFDWLSATGTAILFAAPAVHLRLRMKPKDALTTFARTLKDLALPIYSIGMVLAFALSLTIPGCRRPGPGAGPIPATRLPSSRRSLAGWGIPDRFGHLV